MIFDLSTIFFIISVLFNEVFASNFLTSTFKSNDLLMLDRLGGGEMSESDSFRSLGLGLGAIIVFLIVFSLLRDFFIVDFCVFEKLSIKSQVEIMVFGREI